MDPKKTLEKLRDNMSENFDLLTDLVLFEQDRQLIADAKVQATIHGTSVVSDNRIFIPIKKPLSKNTTMEEYDEHLRRELNS